MRLTLSALVFERVSGIVACCRFDEEKTKIWLPDYVLAW